MGRKELLHGDGYLGSYLLLGAAGAEMGNVQPCPPGFSPAQCRVGDYQELSQHRRAGPERNREQGHLCRRSRALRKAVNVERLAKPSGGEGRAGAHIHPLSNPRLPAPLLLPSLTQPGPSKEMVAVVTPSLPVLLRPVQSGFRLTPSLKSPSLASSVTSALPDPRAPSVLRALCRSAALRHSRPSRNRSFGSHNAPFSWFCPPSAVFFRFLRCLFLLYLTYTHLLTSLGFSPGLSSFLFPLSPGELVHPRGFRWIHLNADQSEFLSLIMEVKSHRQPPTASRLAQGKLRPHLSPDTHLSSPGSGHAGPAPRALCCSSSRQRASALGRRTFCSVGSRTPFAVRIWLQDRRLPRPSGLIPGPSENL